jgi:hypothetical protein
MNHTNFKAIFWGHMIFNLAGYFSQPMHCGGRKSKIDSRGGKGLREKRIFGVFYFNTYIYNLIIKGKYRGWTNNLPEKNVQWRYKN